MSAEIVVMTTALTLLAVFVWSGVVTIVDALAPARVDGRQERLLLTLMIAPTIVGIVTMFAESVSPSLTFSFPDLETVNVETFSAALQDMAARKRTVDWMKWAAFIGVGAYAIGAGALIVRLAVHTFRLHRVAAQATPMNYDKENDVAITSEDLPAYASLSGLVIVPRRLVDTLTAGQLKMIIEHEQAHIRRNDTAAFLAYSLLDAVFWISPFVRRQTNRCRLAAEIACDDAVTRSAPHLRDSYAMTLVSVLKQSSENTYSSAATIFSTRSKSEHQVRIRRIMEGVAPAYAKRGAAVLIGLAALMAPLAFAQFEITQSTSTQPPEFSVAPIEGRLINVYGEHNQSYTEALDHGAIIAAPSGTPVVAPADGRVVFVVSHPDGYGEFVVLDHGDAFIACFGPLADIEVAPGARIAAGQILGRVVSNIPGKAPFLFIDARKDGALVDPASVMNISDVRS